MPPTNDVASPSDPQVIAGLRLADTITAWNEQNPDRPVTIAAVHEPYAVPPLYGHVPLVLTGHFHSRDVSDRRSGTTVMREGTTGGAGISADFRAILEGDPLPLSATLLYFARSGPRAGQVLAYDEVTVGGFGLASATVERTVLREPPAGRRGGGAGGPLPGAEQLGRVACAVMFRVRRDESSVGESLTELAGHLVTAAGHLGRAARPGRRGARCRRPADQETDHAAEAAAHAVLRGLAASFVTPFDRPTCSGSAGRCAARRPGSTRSPTPSTCCGSVSCRRGRPSWCS